MNVKTHTVQVVVPCYNESESLEYFIDVFDIVADRLISELNVSVELILVDDGSKDDTLQKIRQICEKYSYARYVSFSRNFGKEAAIYAGITESTGDFVGLMDADLQDPPELLVEMTETLLNDEYDCVATRRSTRKGEPPIRSWFAHRFYSLINKISDADIVD